MLPDRVSNPGPLTYESGALPIALRGPALAVFLLFCHFLVFEKSDISWVDIYCSCIRASYALIFHATELSKSFICYTCAVIH